MLYKLVLQLPTKRCPTRHDKLITPSAAFSAPDVGRRHCGVGRPTDTNAFGSRVSYGPVLNWILRGRSHGYQPLAGMVAQVGFAMLFSGLFGMCLQ
jgi:hypothetical protein